MPRNPSPYIRCRIFLRGGGVMNRLVEEVPYVETDDDGKPIGSVLQHICWANDLEQDEFAWLDPSEVISVTYRYPPGATTRQPSRPVAVSGKDLVDALRELGGSAESIRQLCQHMRRGQGPVLRTVEHLKGAGVVTVEGGPRNATRVVLTGRGLPD